MKILPKIGFFVISPDVVAQSPELRCRFTPGCKRGRWLCLVRGLKVVWLRSYKIADIWDRGLHSGNAQIYFSVLLIAHDVGKNYLSLHSKPRLPTHRMYTEPYNIALHPHSTHNWHIPHLWTDLYFCENQNILRVVRAMLSHGTFHTKTLFLYTNRILSFCGTYMVNSWIVIIHREDIFSKDNISLLMLAWADLLAAHVGAIERIRMSVTLVFDR